MVVNMKHLLVLAVLLASTVFAVVPNTNDAGPASRIANGETVTQDKVYYFASIAVGGQHICGGMIYSERWIITAASCVYGRTASQLEITVGSTSLTIVEESEQILNVFSIYYFDTPYDPVTKLHDIALLELTRDIKLSEGVVNFITYEEPDLKGKGTIAGFGAIEADGLLTTRLRSAEVTLDGAVCTGSNFNRAYMFCAGIEDDMGAGPCSYDEGSPMIQNQGSFGTLAVGIVSNFTSCGDPTKPSAIYTQLASYYFWIQNTAGQQPTTAGGGAPTTTTTTTTTTTLPPPTTEEPPAEFDD